MHIEQRRADAVRIGDHVLAPGGREYRVVSVRLEGAGGGRVSLALAGEPRRAVLSPSQLVTVRRGGTSPGSHRVRPEAGLR